MSGVGGSVEAICLTFGSDDMVAIVDAPSHEAMASHRGHATLTIDYTPPGG